MTQMTDTGCPLEQRSGVCAHLLHCICKLSPRFYPRSDSASHQRLAVRRLRSWQVSVVIFT
jgi:hypothetical protein